MNAKIAQTLHDAVIAFFSGNCKLIPSDSTKGAIAMKIPLSGYDDEDIVLFLEEADDRTIIHDGGYLVNYLANHEIVVNKKAKRYEVYYRFYEDLAVKHGFSYSEQARRFEMQVDAKEGRKVLVFVECLIALSFLVMTKSAGLKVFSLEDLQKLSGLKLTLGIAFPDMKVAQGLLPEVQEKAAPQTWGLTLSVPPEKARGCVHYLRGPDWTHILRGAIVLNTFSQMSQTWFNTKPECFWGVYGGPPELFEDACAILKALGNGHTAQLFCVEARESLVNEVSDRLGVQPRKDWLRILKLQQGSLSEIARIGKTSEALESAKPESGEFWSKTALDSLGGVLSAGFDAAAHRLLGEAEFSGKFASEALETYGLPFARYVLSGIKERPGKVSLSRFNQIADAFLQYYQNNADASDVVDREVVEIESRITSSTIPAQVFREEEQSVNRYLAEEVKSLRVELARFIETMDGK